MTSRECDGDASLARADAHVLKVHVDADVNALQEPRHLDHACVDDARHERGDDRVLTVHAYVRARGVLINAAKRRMP